MRDFPLKLEKAWNFFRAHKALIGPSQHRLSAHWVATTKKGKCGEQNGGPSKRSRPNLLTCEYVTLDGKRDFADLIKWRILKWRDPPELPRRTQSNYMIAYKQGPFPGCGHREMRQGREGQRDAILPALKMVDRGHSPGPWAASR